MQNFYLRFLQSVEKYPESIALELQPSDAARPVLAVSYGELRGQAEAVAAWLLQNGVAANAKCSILAANEPRWVAAYLGVMAAGAVAVPLDTAFKSDQVAKLLDDSDTGLIFTDAKHLATAEAAVAGTAGSRKVRIVMLHASAGGHEGLDDVVAQGPATFSPVASGPDDVAVILYTSGTTSDPKGVMLTHGNLDAEASAVFQMLSLDNTDSILGVLPLFHALAQMANLLLPLAAGMRVVYLEELNTTELIRALRERRVTLFVCVPQFFYLIHERVFKEVQARGRAARAAFRVLFSLARAGRKANINLGKVFFAHVHSFLGRDIRFLITGGSRFDVKIGHDLETLGFDIMQAYGLTECTGGATVTRPGARFNGSAGKPLAGLELRIAREGGLAEDNSGEVLFRGAMVMKGYYERPDANAQVFKDGWFHTGDLGYVDGACGDLFITGRKKEMIVLSSGKNIYPEEVEAHYAQSPWIKEICVMGLQSKPGEPFSERLHAVIVPDFEKLREKRIVNMKEVIRFDVETLSAQATATKRILSYEIWQQELPRTTTRKLKRYAIEKMVRDGSGGEAQSSSASRELSAADETWMAEPVAARALKVIREAAKTKKTVHPADNLELDLGLDSMERVELVTALEEELNSQADEETLTHVYTVRELVEAVRAGMGAGAARRAGWDEVFAQEPSEPEVLAAAESKPLMSAFWFVVGLLLRPVIKLLFRLDVSGIEKLPKHGPYIICPNHQSFLEAPVLIALLPYRILKDLFYVGTSEIFGTSELMRRIALSLKVVPVDPDANLVTAMRAGSYGLKQGKILMLFPEGERSIDGEPKTFKKGAAILSVQHQAPIYPIALDGFFEAWPRGKGFQGFRKARIQVGDAILPPVTRSEESYSALTAELKERVMQMWTPMHKRAKAQRAATAD